MAYGLRARIEYKDINNVLTRIDFEHEGFAGVADVRYANAGIEIKYGDSGTTQFPLVYGSQITVYFDAESDYEFLDFFTANSRKTKILTYKNDVLKHVAFGEADTWHEPLIAAPYGVSLTGYDGLGLLKDEDFLNADKTPYEGEKTPIEILSIILGKTGLDLPINTAVGLRPAGTTGDPLLAVLKDVVSYAGKSCYEVLEMLFRGCRIFQRNGEWWVISNDKWGGSSITCYHYTAAGVADGTVIIDTEITGFWMENEASFDYMPAMKEMKVTQIFGYKPNLLKNSDFEEINEAGNFDNWTAVGVVPQQRVYDADGNKFVYLPGVERLDPWDSANRTKYLVSDSVIVSQASDIFNVKLSYALMGPEGSAGYVFFGLFLEGDNGIDYALQAYLTDMREVHHRWLATSHKLAVPVSANRRRNRNGIFPDTWEVGPDYIESYPYDDVMNHFASTAIAVEGGIPTTGTISVYLFLAHTGSTVAGSCFREIKMFLTDQDEQELPTQTEFSIVNDAGNNYVPDDLELLNGDLPDIANRMTAYDGGFILNDGSEEGTLLWQLDGKLTTYTYAELVARLIAAEMKLARQAYQARLGDVIPSTAMVFTDANNSDKRFVESGATYDDRMQAMEGRYIELKDFDIDSFTVGSIITYADKGVNSSSNPAKVIDTDERVKLIDPETYNVEGQQGYLNSDDFEQIIDEESGRALISNSWKRVGQTAHGFTAGNAICHNGTTWVKAIADPDGNLRATAIVRKVTDVDTFICQSEGFFPDATFTPGTWYYLSASTAGEKVTTAPESGLVQCLGFVTDRGWKIEISDNRLNIPSLPPQTLSGPEPNDTLAIYDVSMARHRKISLYEIEEYLDSEGFLTSFTETDPVFTASAAAGITGTNITNWNTAYGWGNHATAGYLTSFTEADPVFTASAAAGITGTNITNWNTAYGWGNHATAGYLTDAPSDGTTYGRKDGSWVATAASQWVNDTNGISYTDGNVGIGSASHSQYLFYIAKSVFYPLLYLKNTSTGGYGAYINGGDGETRYILTLGDYQESFKFRFDAEGHMFIRPSATPSTDATYGKLWMSSTDNLLYFKDKAGNVYDLTDSVWTSDTYGIHYNNDVGIGTNSNSLYKLLASTSLATTGSTAVKGENTAAVTNAFGVVAAVTAGLEGSAGIYGYNTSSTTSLHYGGFFNAQNGSNGIGVWAIGGLCAARFGGSIQLQEISSLATPASSYGALYVKTDGKLYFKNDAGTETALT